MGILYALKSLTKYEAKTRRKVPFILHQVQPIYFSLLFLFYVTTFRINNVQYAFSSMLSKKVINISPAVVNKTSKSSNFAIFFAFQINLIVVVILGQILFLNIHF